MGKMTGILELENEINKIIIDIYEDEVSVFNKMPELIGKVQKEIEQFFADVPRFAAVGVEVPVEVVVAQLQNLLNAVEKRDCILLIDVLTYEILDTLQVYKELLEVVGE